MNLGMPSILLIDDEVDVIQMYSTKLEDAGLKVFVAHDGYEGLDTAREHKPDLILLDFLMPGLSGMDVLLKLRDNPDTENISVVFLTMSPLSTEDEKLAKEKGVTEYIGKDLDIELLVDHILELMNTLPPQ